MVNIIIRSATQVEVDYVCTHMRQADKTEIWASHRRTPKQAAIVCGNVSPHIALVDGVPCIIFGCTRGTPWLLATPLIQTIGVRFIRGSKDFVDEWLDQYKVLENYVHADNEVSIQWLKWLGFSFKETVIVNDEKFIRFVKRRDDDVRSS